jgi:5-methylcytosine-specific restriction protein A
MSDLYGSVELAAFTVSDYVSAFQAVPLPHRDRELLVTNYHTPGRTITAKQMAQTLGFSSHGAANLHYGSLAKRVGEHLGVVPEFAALLVLVSMDWPGGECEWTLRPQVAAALEQLGWVQGFRAVLPEEVSGEMLEGSTFRVIVNAYERSPVARERCIQHYGPVCVICGFNFGRVYGPVVEGLIHVHHLRPLSEIGGAYTVDPVADLRPVCPNCHAVLHSRTPVYSIEEVRNFLKHTGIGTW